MRINHSFRNELCLLWLLAAMLFPVKSFGATDVTTAFGLDQTWFSGDKFFTSTVKKGVAVFEGTDYRGSSYRFELKQVGKSSKFKIIKCTPQAIYAEVGDVAEYVADEETRQCFIVLRNRQGQILDIIAEDQEHDSLLEAMASQMVRLLKGSYVEEATGEVWTFPGSMEMLKGSGEATRRCPVTLENDNAGQPVCLGITDPETKDKKWYIVGVKDDGVELFCVNDLKTTIQLKRNPEADVRPRFEQYQTAPLSFYVLAYFVGSPFVADFMRNELYAAKGYTFSKETWKQQFAGKSWYKPLGNNAQVELTTVESLNVEFLKAATSRLAQ